MTKNYSDNLRCRVIEYLDKENTYYQEVSKLYLK